MEEASSSCMIQGPAARIVSVFSVFMDLVEVTTVWTFPTWVDFHANHPIISKFCSFSKAILFHALHRSSPIHDAIIFVIDYCQVRGGLRRVKQIYQKLNPLTYSGR